MTHYTLLILDSHDGAAFVTQRSLQWNLGPQATIGLASSPGDVWEQCTRTVVDLLLIDPTEYGEAAWTLVHFLREIRSPMPIVVLAAHCTPPVMRRARELGISCLSKTDEMNDICRTVRLLLGMTTTDPAPIES